MVLEFRPEHTDAFGTCASHPAKTGAEKFMLCFAFQAASESFLVEVPKFPGRFHPVGKVPGEGVALSSVNANTMETGNGVPADVTFGIK